MSCIVGLVEEQNIWIGVDSRVSETDGLIRPYPGTKLFKLNNNIIFAFVGNVRFGQLLTQIPYENLKNEIELASLMQEYLLDKMPSGDDLQSEYLAPVNSLVIFKGKLFEILSDFQVHLIEDFTSLGSGSSFAIASLYTSKNMDIGAKERILLALSTAAQYDSSTGPPFIVEKFPKR